MMVDIEYTKRKNNRLSRLIKNADFDQPDANIMDLDYISGCKLNKSIIQKIATCDYISDYRNVFLPVSPVVAKPKCHVLLVWRPVSGISRHNTFVIQIFLSILNLPEVKALTKMLSRNTQNQYCSSLMNGSCSSRHQPNAKISSNCYIKDERNLLPSSVLNTERKDGMNKLAGMTVLWQMPF